MSDRPVDNAKTSAPVIRVVNVAKHFGDKTVLDGVSLEVMHGRTMVIMGGSGCGKSTLLRIITGLLWPDEGHVELLGRDLNEIADEELDGLRKKFGILFQSGALFNSLSVGENVALPLREHTDLDDETIDIMVHIKLELVGLREEVNLMPSELSGGMKKRAGLARAIALDPEILFYDEPSAGLDPVTTAGIDQLIMDLSDKLGVTSVVVTHDVESAFRIGDRMAMLDKGRVLRTGTVEEFRAIREGPPSGDEAADTIRQFLRGDSEGPITRRRPGVAYEQDILDGLDQKKP
jgi:phospholipid/cholesterol/gamma-HCH transport system ATP-binding protein